MVLSAHEKPLILVVDDTPENLMLMATLLRDRYRVRVANSGVKALNLAQSEVAPDLILLDIMMPEMDGYEVCRLLKANPKTSEIPVIFLTARTDVQDEETGLNLGAVDYISKPISPAIVMARIETHLRLKASSDFLRDRACFLEQEVNRRARDVIAIQDATVMSMASLAETRDIDTGHHIRRTQYFVKILAERLRLNDRYAELLTPEFITLLFRLAPLHDIGKVGIPDHILMKPGPLTSDEFSIMKTHTTLGASVLEFSEKLLAEPIPFFKHAKELTRSHHERWDGKGYPDGLSGQDIPLSARLMAVADVYDALSARRVYKEPFPPEKTLQIMREGQGTQFDPLITDIFFQSYDEIHEVAMQWGDR